MKIQAIKLTLSEQDLNELVSRYMPADQPIEDLQVRVSPTGLAVTGVYPLFINVHFETLWKLGLDQGQVTAQLSHFKAMGVPGNIFKSAIVKMIEDLAAAEDWIRVRGDTIWLDVDGCIRKYAFSAQTHFTSLICEAGSITVEGKE